MGAKSEVKFKYEKVLKEFLDVREWEDELDQDVEKGEISLNTNITFANGQDMRLIIEGNNNGLLRVFWYFDSFLCKKEKFPEMLSLLNSLHMRIGIFGTFNLINLPDSPSNGKIRWLYKADFEGIDVTLDTLHLITNPSNEIVENYGELISAVALTKQSASDALKEFDEARSETNDETDEDEVPDQL